MTANDPVATDVAGALHEGLATAKRAGASSVAAEHLRAEQLETLVEATLARLRSVPGKESEIEGWSLVTARDAAVITWWAEVAGLTDGERRRVGSLRRDVYDLLVERHLIKQRPGRSTSVHVSPAAAERESEGTKLEGTEAAQADAGPSSAWVLKLSPYLYDVGRVFAAPDRRVHVWSVEDHQRAARMRYGDRVYLWVSEGDPYRAAGIWGVGYVAGPTVLGVADDGWLDYEAASRASVFAVVDITLLDAPVDHQAFLDDARLVEAEVVRVPHAPNPGVLTASEAAALAEYLSKTGAPSEWRVA